MKVNWSDLLKRELYKFPPNGREYHTPDNIIFTVHVKKKKITRHYTFGGHYSASLYFHKNSIIDVTFLSPFKKPFSFSTRNVVKITMNFFPESILKIINKE